ncbi:MAG TPA: hypothetical protein VJX92_13180 [Methylomirabilota bacterium]|nr:hypothetical protein [Methylomirabilota bacterium]
MRARVASMLLAGTLTACSSVSATLPYKPEVQPPGAFVSAAYTVVSDVLRVEIDTGGLRLERAQLIKPGATLEAQTIEYPMPAPAGPPIGIGLGVGTFGGGLGGGVGTGVGVSTSAPLGRGGLGGGTSIASFPLAEAGPSPWRVRVRIQGNDPVDILVGEPAPTR